MVQSEERVQGASGKPNAGNASAMCFGPDGSVFLDTVTGEIYCAGAKVPPQSLTASELAIVKYLHNKRSHSATVDELYSLTHSGEADGETKNAAQRKRSIQQHVCNIRLKIAKAGGSEGAIATNRATEGYRLVLPNSPDFHDSFACFDVSAGSNVDAGYRQCVSDSVDDVIRGLVLFTLKCWHAGEVEDARLLLAECLNEVGDSGRDAFQAFDWA